jgi:hypothetical protein
MMCPHCFGIGVSFFGLVAGEVMLVWWWVKEKVR